MLLSCVCCVVAAWPRPRAQSYICGDPVVVVRGDGDVTEAVTDAEQDLLSGHDWTLIVLDINWQTGELRIEMLDDASEHRVWIANNLVSKVLPRQHPWGPSASINRVEVSTGNGVTARLEMQSGDLIECVAGSFDLR